MAVTKPGKNTALAALTTAALSLPGLNAEGAVPVTSIKTNVSYGHYQESDNRMQVDVYHADAIIPLSERLEFAFSIDRDTYSGATPAFSIPESLTNLPKYKLKTDDTPSNQLSYVDLVSAASGGVTAGGLTKLGGLNTFASYSDNSETIKPTLDAEVLAAKLVLDAAKAADLIKADAQYQINLASLNPNIPTLNAQYQVDKAAIEADIAAAPSISSTVTINFSPGMAFSSYDGYANTTPSASGNCSGSGGSGCYYEDNMVIGIVRDSSSTDSHLHRIGSDATNTLLGYHSDSSGVYIRSLDSKAFSLDSMRFKAPIDALSNPGNGVNDYWEILGFNTALNPLLDVGDGTNYATRVAYQTVANGFNSTLLLNSDFKNISAVWIHYKGYTKKPTDGKQFEMNLDNIKVSPASPYISLFNSYNTQLTTLLNTYNAQSSALADPVQLATLAVNYEAQKTAKNE